MFKYLYEKIILIYLMFICVLLGDCQKTSKEKCIAPEEVAEE